MRRNLAIQLLHGFCMGVADIIPGVSGGTIALMFGIYDRLIRQISNISAALTSLIRRDLDRCIRQIRQVEWGFLCSLLLGILLALALLVGSLRNLIHDYPVAISSLFFGVVAASAVIARREISRWRLSLYILFIASSATTFALLGIRSGSIREPGTYMIFIAGAIAICAMVLPGVSGSFILLMLGLYDHAIGALEQFELSVLSLYLSGAVVGVLAFSRALNVLLSKHRDLVVALLLGLMIGSLRVLWPWPSDNGGLENTRLGFPENNEIFGASIAVLVGVLLVGLIMKLAGVAENFRSNDALQTPS